jgi:hypothetical protein
MFIKSPNGCVFSNQKIGKLSSVFHVIDECQFCEPEKSEELIYEDDTLILTICKTCKDPIVIIKKHVTKLSQGEFGHVRVILEKHNLWIPNKIDYERGTSPNHWHCHVRLSLWDKILRLFFSSFTSLYSASAS